MVQVHTHRKFGGRQNGVMDGAVGPGDRIDDVWGSLNAEYVVVNEIYVHSKPFHTNFTTDKDGGLNAPYYHR